MNLTEIKEIRALSWKQPFSELMLHGKVETRTWDTRYRGLVLICASQKGYTTDELLKISGEGQMMRMHELPGYDTIFGDIFLDGKAFAIGKLVNTYEMQPYHEDRCFVRYREPWIEEKKTKNGSIKRVEKKLYCHEYEDVKPIKPFNWKGTQGWKKLNQNEITKIEFL